MDKFIDITENNKNSYNTVVSHPIQTYEWGEFRKKTGIKVIRRGLINDKGEIIDGFTLTIHKIPYLPFYIGYLPRGNFPTEIEFAELKQIAKKEKCLFIQLEPNIRKEISNFKFQISNLRTSFNPFFFKHTHIIDLTKKDDELLKNMHPKTRYNIKLAKKRGVFIEEDNSEKGFNNYLKLTFETTQRQGFYAHSKEYHKKLWETLKENSSNKNNLIYHLLHAKIKDADNNIHTLATWVLFTFHDTLYYPYGASSNLFRETMASNLLAWQAIQFGKKLGLSKFDLWGCLGPNANTKDPWYGFHRFKQGYGGEFVEYIGSYDLIINPIFYNLIKFADKIRWFMLFTKAKTIARLKLKAKKSQLQTIQKPLIAQTPQLAQPKQD